MIWGGDIHWAHPYAFLALLVIPIWVYMRRYRRDYSGSVQLPSIPRSRASWRVRIVHMLPWLRVLSYCFLVVALARPQRTHVENSIKGKGIDIMITMDVSLSMLAKDFDPDRLSVSKRMAADFVRKRPADKIGLVMFSGEAFAQCPLTIDHDIVQEFIQNLSPGILELGTDIGSGLGSAVNRLKESSSKSKIIILLTDGVNNREATIDPLNMADLASDLYIKVYTIGIGSTGMALTPNGINIDGSVTYANTKVEIDEILLQTISDKTGGRYFRAVDGSSLANIYAEIDRLEKSEYDAKTVSSYVELYRPWMIIAMIMLLSAWILQYFILRPLAI
jgi:Ca-activated chloride channel homolog